MLGGMEALEAGKAAWLADDGWQGLRRYVEDSFVVQDPFELLIAQNLALDGLLYPLVYETLVDGVLAARSGPALSMLTGFMEAWAVESRKWVDATLKTAVAESAENRALVARWTRHWSDRARSALTPLAVRILGPHADVALDEVSSALAARLAKAGLEI
jgi:phenol hydroxylase P1 protein